MNINDDKELLQSIEEGEWKTVSNFEEIKKNLMAAAAETAIKDYRINVRISKRDVEALKTKALEDGIPYQTLVTSILHKYVTGRLQETHPKETKETSFA
ncbi:MAG: antitoxin [Rectinema sp.]|jgi:predicted DNA binding CopG/RHH family protein